MKNQENRLLGFVKGKKFLIVSGKGGVGKTTFSASLGLKLAELGRNTLVVSIDPAHSLGDAFGKDLNENIQKITKNLYGLEFDPIKLFSTEKEVLIQALRQESGSNLFVPLDEESLDILADFQMPYEFAEGMGFIKLVYGLLEDKKFDNIIIDTAPTGHTIELLKLPEILESFYGKLIRFRLKLSRFVSRIKMIFGFGSEDSSDKALRFLEESKEIIATVRDALTNADITEFLIVMIPNDMSIFETLRLIGELEAWNIPNNNINVNFVRIYGGECKFSRTLAKYHKKQLIKIKNKIPDKSIWVTPYFAEEIRGIDKLKKMADFIGQISIDDAIRMIDEGLSID